MIKRIFFILLTILSLQTFGQETFPVNGVAREFEPIYAFVNARIIISPEKEIENGTLLIQGNKILDLDSNIEIPENAIIQDLNGDYIYPAFIDLYTKYGLAEIQKKNYSKNPQYKSKKDGAYHWNQAIHPEIIAANDIKNDTKKAKEFRDLGFGTVLSHQQDGIVRGTGALILLSEEKEHKNILLKNASAHYSFRKGSSKQKYPTSLMGSIALLRQTYLDVDWYNQGVEEINYSYESFIWQQDLPQIFEINNAFDISRVLKIADEFEKDYIIKGNGDEYRQLEIINETRFSFILPLNFPKSYDVSDPEEAENFILEQLKHWETAPYNPTILSNNNIEFAFTSFGIKNKKDFLKNLRKSIEKGLPKTKALAALTTTPSSFIKAEKLIGSLEKGKIANFIITSEDIFEKGVIYENWIAGKQYIVTKKQKFDPRGFYTLNSDEYNNVLVSIKGERNKPKAFIYLFDSVALNTSLNNNEISISTNDGSYRSVGLFNNGFIKGRYQDEKGLYHTFSMTRDSSFQNVKKKGKTEVDTIIPKIWFPNQAYGFMEKPNTENIFFKNATIWTNEIEGILRDSEIAIKDGKILAVGKGLDISSLFKKDEVVKTIDAKGNHITCGIIDEHSHIAITRGVNESSQAVTAEVRIGDVIKSNDHNIYRQLAGGVTASQLLHGSANPIGGQSAIIKLHWGSSAEEMKIEGADGFIKFALGENVKQSNWSNSNRTRFPQTRMGVEQIFYDAFYRARAYETEWKLYNTMSQSMKRNAKAPREDLELNTLIDILNKKRFVTCHSYVQSEINMLMHVSDSMHFNINTFTHILEGYKVAKQMKKHGAGGSTFSDWWAYKFEVNDAIPYNATLLNNAGVVTAINSDDAEMGRRLNQEASKAVKYGGTSEEDAWKMVTLNPAKLLHLDDRMGSLKVGNDADIVIWTENPLSIYAKVLQTYVNGICLFDKDRDKKMLERDLKERMRIIKKMMKDKGKKESKRKKKEKLYHCNTLEP